jgi:GTP-binding protein HflX
LLNALTDADALVEDQLFATLDSTVRRLTLPPNRQALLADTVGLVRRLPHHLVEAFRSTLAEVSEADLLIHLVDSTDPDPAGQIAAVREVLVEIGAGDLPELMVFNKADALSGDARHRLESLYPEAIFISALTGDGFDDLLGSLAENLERRMVSLVLEVPYERGDVVASAHRLGEVLAEKHDEHGTILEVRVPQVAAASFSAFSR